MLQVEQHRASLAESTFSEPLATPWHDLPSPPDVNINQNSDPDAAKGVTVDPVRPREPDADAEADSQDQDPGETQRRNQGFQEEDPLAA